MAALCDFAVRFFRKYQLGITGKNCAHLIEGKVAGTDVVGGPVFLLHTNYLNFAAKKHRITRRRLLDAFSPTYFLKSTSS